MDVRKSDARLGPVPLNSETPTAAPSPQTSPRPAITPSFPPAHLARTAPLPQRDASAVSVLAFQHQKTVENGVALSGIKANDDIASFLTRKTGSFDHRLYQRIVGAANAFKEGDITAGVAAADDLSRQHARALLSRSTIGFINAHPLHEDDLSRYAATAVDRSARAKLEATTLGALKETLLTATDTEIRAIMPGLTSDVIACVVKLASNEELTAISAKIFNPMPGTNIGAKGYMGARLQPNSPTDNPEDIVWQVFNGFSFATGDVVLGTNPVDGTPKSVARVEAALKDIVETFGLKDVLPWCVLAHIDAQGEVEKQSPGTVTELFQSLAGNDDTNQTFDIDIEKLRRYATSGVPVTYWETGQGSEVTNGKAHGVDMVTLEARKYGLARALNAEHRAKVPGARSHTNDVAGFIGPEVFTTKEQLVRVCLEDTVMGKLHGLTVGLDVCSTMHMSLSPADLDWCLDRIMPANPAYLMALPTKNDPMLSYLTTSFQDHVRLREKFNYKIDDRMAAFFTRIGIMDARGNLTEHAGDPLWVYYQYRLAKGDTRSKEAISEEGKIQMAAVSARQVPLAIGHGARASDPKPELQAELELRYQDAKRALRADFSPEFIASVKNAVPVASTAKDREDHIAHPATGEALKPSALRALQRLKESWGDKVPDVQIVISDGLNANAIMNEGHLAPYLEKLNEELKAAGISVSDKPIVLERGRVRAGYAIGTALFSDAEPRSRKAIVHVIGERPGTAHDNYSVYIAAPPAQAWRDRTVDHDIVNVISGISDTALDPQIAAASTVEFLKMEKTSA
jgi:ethanolamine ammonia-lyase large subunit